MTVEDMIIPRRVSSCEVREEFDIIETEPGRNTDWEGEEREAVRMEISVFEREIVRLLG